LAFGATAYPQEDAPQADLEITGSKEDWRGADRQNIEANRGRDTTKGIQSGTVSRLPSLKLRRSKAPWPPAMDGEVGLKAKYTGALAFAALWPVLRFIKVVTSKRANIRRSAGYWPDQSSHPLCFWRIKRSAPSGWH
jgi:hypothetical protein